MKFVFATILITFIIISYYCFYTEINTFTVDNLENHLPVMDVGCGNCCLSHRLNWTSESVVPVDVRDLGVCRRPQLYDPSIDDGLADLIRTSGVRSVLLKFVLHHVDDHNRLIRQLKGVQRVVVIEDTPVDRWDLFMNRAHLNVTGFLYGGSTDDSTKNHFLTKPQWVGVFLAHGFSLTTVTSIPRIISPVWYPVSRTMFVFDRQGR